MKTKRFLALVIAMLMIMTCFASCRTKDENAFTFTYGDKTVNIRTALYMCFVIDADVEFQNSAITAAEEAGTEYEDYKELKYEDKDYDTWTKQKAKEAAEKYAYAEIEFERLGYTIGEDEQSYIDYYAQAQWDGDQSTAGVSAVYEANGISYDTYKAYFTNSYWKQEMVYNFYIEEKTEEEHDHEHEDETTTTEKKLDPAIEKLRGSLRPSDKEINSTLLNNYIPVYVIDVSFTDDNGQEKDDDTKKTQLAKLNEYAQQIKNGTDFAKVYATYQSEFGLTTSTDSSSAAGEYEGILLSAKANENENNGTQADENFSDVLKLGINEVKVFENDDCYRLVVRKDILNGKDSSGTAYKDSYSSSAINLLVLDKYESDIVDKLIKELKVDENTSAIDYYTADKIDYLNDETEAVAETQYAQ